MQLSKTITLMREKLLTRGAYILRDFQNGQK